MNRPVLPVCNRIEVFVREGCPHCQLAKGYLESLQARKPGLEIIYRETGGNPGNRTALLKLSAEHHVERPGVPTFDICGKVIVGYSEHVTPAEIEQETGGAGKLPQVQIP